MKIFDFEKLPIQHAPLALALIPLLAIAVYPYDSKSFYLSIGLISGTLFASVLTWLGAALIVQALNGKLSLGHGALLIAGFILSAMVILHVYSQIQYFDQFAKPAAENFIQRIWTLPHYASGRFGAILAIAGAFALAWARWLGWTHFSDLERSGRIAALAGIVALVLASLLMAIHQFTSPLNTGNWIFKDKAIVLSGLASAPLAGLGGLAIWAASRVPAVREFFLPSSLAPVTSGFDRNNRIWVAILGLVMPSIGSAGSALVAAAGVWAFISVAAGRFPWRQPPGFGILYAALAGYLGVMAIATFWNLREMAELFEFLQLALVALAPFLIARFLMSPPTVLYVLLKRWLALGMTLLFAVALWQFVAGGPHGYRISAFSGNSIPAGTVAVFFAIVLLSGVSSLSGRIDRIYALTAFSGVLTALMTQSVSVILAILFVSAKMISYYFDNHHEKSRRKYSYKEIIKIITVAALIALPIGVPGAMRIKDYISALSSPEGQIEGSFILGERWQMWGAAIDAISEKPLIGYGLQNRASAIVPFLPEGELKADFRYSTLHNAFLTAGVAAGLPGVLATLLVLLAPVFCVRTAQNRQANGTARLLADSFTLTFLSLSIAGIVFFHDIQDAIYVLSITLVGYLLWRVQGN